MAYPVGRLFAEMDMPQSDRDILTGRCEAADLVEAIDIAFVDAAMIPDILGRMTGGSANYLWMRQNGQNPWWRDGPERE